MSEAQYHLVVNHFPLVLLIVSIFVWFYYVYTKNEIILKIAQMIILSACITAGLSMFTGDYAEEVIKMWPGIEKKAIHMHEERAEVAMGFMWALFAITLADVVLRAKKMKPEWSPWLQRLSLLLLGVLVALFVQVGHLGGLIRHQELDHQPPVKTIAPTESAAPASPGQESTSAEIDTE